MKLTNQKNDTSVSKESPFSVTSLSKDNATKSNAIEIPKIELPKGGGAIKGIDEKFEVNAVNGTASFSIPLPFSAGRHGMKPELGLGYNSGGGKGVFGLGWSVGIQNIQRKTEKELPQYKDDGNSDTFIISGAEDLVPILIEENGNWVPDIQEQNGEIIKKYRPRIEGLFARIEHIQNGDVNYWKVTSKDNVISIYGKAKTTQIFNPENPQQIFRWNLEYTYDDKGNLTWYRYKKEDGTNLDTTVNERNRLNGLAKFTNCYLKEVFYGNKSAFYPGEDFPNSSDYLFRGVFDYGEHSNNSPSESRPWKTRTDPFSSYRSGFEIRTYRLCERVLMFHQFEELSPNPYLVRSLDLEYQNSSNITYLTKCSQKGYIWTASGNLKEEMALPPMEFTYSKNPTSWVVQSITKEKLKAIPDGLAGNAQWVDLFSEGVSGLLTENDSAWFYKSNLGMGEFSEPLLVAPKPSYSGLNNQLAILELQGNGNKQLVQHGKNGGFFELDPCENWKPFQTFENYPNINLQDANLKQIDLNGDGLTELLISKESEFAWYPSIGKKGYGDYRVAAKASHEEEGPKVLFSDSHAGLLIATADMCGDGLNDIVLIENGSVCYYPNLGYGRFGAKVTMAMNGSFDYSDAFNPSHIHLADIDGSGTTDIIYVGKNKIQVRYNHNGNQLDGPDEGFNPFPAIDNQSRISVLDLLGNGTSCIVWSSALPAYTENPLMYIDITQGIKPHMMVSYQNNMGKEVQLQYKPSTYYYLQDKKAGNPWITKLPFPVHCIHKVTMVDKVAETRFTNSYTYHHGYYDGIEREFRGFAKVVQTDTESFTHFKEHENGPAMEIVSEDLFQPPVITKSWFHTGYYQCRQKYLHQLESEYFNPADSESLDYLLPEYPLPENISANEMAECLRALKGLPLRQEVYSTEGDPALHNIPYTITQHNYDIQKLQSKNGLKHAVFLSTEKENAIFHLERNVTDPRINHNINTNIDEYGNVLESATIVYGRQQLDDNLPSDSDRKIQSATHIIYTQNRFTQPISTQTDYRLPLAFESQTFELKCSPPENFLYSSIEIATASETANEAYYDAKITVGQKRKLEHSKILYLKDDLSGPMPFGKMDTRALPYQNYQLAFTPEMLVNRYGTHVDEALLRNQGHYVRFEGDDNFWIRSGLGHYHPLTDDPQSIRFVPPPSTQDLENAKGNFFLPTVFEDPLGNLTKVKYDRYQLYMEQSVDALDNTITVLGFNHRTLTPYHLSDPNGNRTAARFNALGLPIALFTMGKEGENLGDRFQNSSLEAHGNDRPSMVLEYDFVQFQQATNKANFIKTIAYEAHRPDSTNKAQITIAYSDGSGNVVLEKSNAEAGKVTKYNWVTGQKESNHSPERWVGSGRTILNNKGNPIKQYEPFFDDNEEYTKEVDLVCQGYSPLMYYDALGRLIKTKNADGTFKKIVFDAWKQEEWDENDTIEKSSWFTESMALPTQDPKRKAAEISKVHANTPNTAYLDSLGRIFLTVQHNKWNRKNGIQEVVHQGIYHTRIVYDLESNPLKLIDARGNVVMQWQYDLLGHRVFENSMDAGKRYFLPDALQRPIRTWDSRQHMITQNYDELNRPLSNTLYDKNGDRFTFQRHIYGEHIPNAKEKNLRGQLYQLYDKSGCVTTAYDFKANAISSAKQLVADYKATPNWPITNPEALLDPKTYTHAYTYDALNRPITHTTPDGSVQKQEYNEAGLLNKLSLQHQGRGRYGLVIQNIDYNAKGQKEAIKYGNGSQTKYTYDQKTYRLVNMRTTRRGNAGGNNNLSLLRQNHVLQDLFYTYDPIGNITQIEDNALNAAGNGGSVNAVFNYTYDALYQLRSATGRENNRPITHGKCDNWNDRWSRHSGLADAFDLRKYSQQYDYDGVGNITQLKHITTNNGGYTRHYSYESGSNRLAKTFVGKENNGNHTYEYHYNTHGSMVQLPHLEALGWNFKEEVAYIQRQRICNVQASSVPLEAWYNYDLESQRSRRVILKPDGSQEEYRYIGNYECYTKTKNGTLVTQSESIHINTAEDDRSLLLETFSISDQPEIEIGKPLYRYQCGNHLGSVSLELDKESNLFSYEEYHPYGTTALSAIHKTIKHFKKRYRYTGMERDDESGLNYHTARYYLPWLGRWLSADPIGIKDGINMSRFSKNNSLIYRDVNGQHCEETISSCSSSQTTPTEELESASLPENDRHTIASWVNIPSKTIEESIEPRNLESLSFSKDKSESEIGPIFDANISSKKFKVEAALLKGSNEHGIEAEVIGIEFNKTQDFDAGLDLEESGHITFAELKLETPITQSLKIKYQTTILKAEAHKEITINEDKIRFAAGASATLMAKEFSIYEDTGHFGFTLGLSSSAKISRSFAVERTDRDNNGWPEHTNTIEWDSYKIGYTTPIPLSVPSMLIENVNTLVKLVK